MGKTIRRSASHYSSTNEFFKNEKVIRYKKNKKDTGWSNHPDFKKEFSSDELSAVSHIITRNGYNPIDTGSSDE